MMQKEQKKLDWSYGHKVVSMSVATPTAEELHLEISEDNKLVHKFRPAEWPVALCGYKPLSKLAKPGSVNCVVCLELARK